MKRILCFLAIVFATAPAWGLDLINHGSPETFIGATSPASLKWEIANAANERVGFEIPNLRSGTFSGISQFRIRPETATLYSFDWAAFQAAANDPAYTRSIMTFSGIERERPLARSFVPGGFVLGSIGFQLEHWVEPINLYGFPLYPLIAVGAASPLNIPEPATWVLVLVAVTLTMLHRHAPRAATPATPLA